MEKKTNGVRKSRQLSIDDVKKQMVVDCLERVMSVNDFAKFVSKSPEAIRKRIQRGLIPAHKEGRNWYILKSEHVSSLRKKWFERSI